MTIAKPDSLAAALAELQQRLPRIGKNAQGQRSRYADLAEVNHQLLPLLGKLGLSFVCTPTMLDGQFVLEYVLRFAGSDEKIEGFYPLPSSTPQTMGGAITYARRYIILALTGAAPDEDDDDAEEAEAAARAQRNRPPEVRADGSATQAELERMTRGHEPGTWHSDGTAENDPFYDQPPGKLPVTYPPGDRQIQRLAMHFKRLGYDDGDTEAREERLVFTAALAGAGEISSSKDLTQEQVKLALGRLEKLRDRAALVDAVEALKESEGASA